LRSFPARFLVVLCFSFGFRLILLGSCLAQSATSTPSSVYDAPHFSVEPKVLYAATSQVSTSDGTDVVVLADDEEYIFDDQGRAIHTQYVIFKVLTQAGIDNWAHISVPWTPWREERPALRVRVISADGEAHMLDPKTISDAPAEEADDDTYSDRRVTRAPFPAVGIGAVIEEEIRTVESPALPAGGIESNDYFGRTVPVQHSRLVLDAPSALPLRYRVQLLPDVETVRHEENGRTKLTFTHGPIKALETADDFLPSNTPSYPSVMFSTGNSWQKLAEAYGKIVDAQANSANMTGLAQKAVAGKIDRTEKIEAIFEYINARVRYTGIEFAEAAIVPRPPQETLKRGYGDCKDKAVLLVALLRAAGIPADVALLNAGEREDVPADLPGIGMFDHAIVYVPGSPAMWIDATDDYARAGQLPSADQGRLALVASAGTTSLVTTTIASSRDNLLVEEREFFLAGYGPAKIIERTQAHGTFESQYRRSYTNLQDKKVRDDLSGYFKAQYLGDKLDRLDRSDPKDFSSPFELTLESNMAKRGETDLTTSVAAIRLEGLFTMLPNELQNREPAKDENADNGSAQPRKKRTADYQLNETFVREWRYRIVPPTGFQPRPLPKNTEISFGPATLTEEFSAENDNVVRAVIRFELTKRTFSITEATELRNKVAELRAAKPLLIYFDPVGQALLSQGKIVEAFRSFRQVIAAQPTEAIPHLRMAEALLSQGLGDAARAEARLAVRLDPKSVVAEKTLADVLEYDLVGRKLRPGSDYAGAAAAFRAARKLDPMDKGSAGNLAILLEYNADGARYGAGADLQGALAVYREITPNDLDGLGLKNNPAFALYYAGDFAEAKKNAETLNPQPKALLVACEAALNDSQSALDEARKIASGDDEFKKISASAGDMLMNKRLYTVAADLMEAGAAGDTAGQIMARAAMMRKAHLHEKVTYGNDPGGFAMSYFFATFSAEPPIETVRSFLSRNALVVFGNTDPEEIKNLLSQGTKVRRSLVRSGASPDVVLDILTQLVQPKVEGDDSSGYRVKIQVPGGESETIFVVKEDGKYKILGSSEKPNSIGLEILDRVGSGDLAGARVLLDWLREEQHLAGGDDPLAGDAFPRLWTKGQEATAAQMKIAAAGILVGTKPTAAQGVTILEAALAFAANDQAKLNMKLALADGYENVEDFQKLYAIAAELTRQNPESRRAFLNASYALRNLGRYDEGDALAVDRLKRLPDDVDALVAQALLAQARGDYPAARVFEQRIETAGKADASTLNIIAWLSLFTGTVTDADIQTAIRGTQLNRNSWPILHTLGCLYVETGKIKESHNVLLQAMDLAELDEPNGEFWYAFGRLAEQFAEYDLAKTDYAKVPKPKMAANIPGSTYLLAQRRLQNMTASSSPASMPTGASANKK
jgi:transglutaminase-like putative cysteine protease/tetratricopeptide (TPR) repeat protein